MKKTKSDRLGILAAVALFGLTVSVVPVIAAGDAPAPPPSDSGGGGGGGGKKKKKRSELEFFDGYKVARALVLEGKYADAIAAFKALDADDSAEVANYIGYANRKLGNYELARIWSEKALELNPKHVRTWQYFGMWHVEQGNMLKAADHLETIRALCGTDCREYQDLKAGMEGKISY